MNSCSYGSGSAGFSIRFSRDIVSVMDLYSCLLFKMCLAYAHWGSLCLMYPLCS
jgi:hypothetical protein